MKERNEGREGEKRERGERNSDFSLRSMELDGRLASGQDLKSEYSSRATLGHQKLQISLRFRAGGS